MLLLIEAKKGSETAAMARVQAFGECLAQVQTRADILHDGIVEKLSEVERTVFAILPLGATVEIMVVEFSVDFLKKVPEGKQSNESPRVIYNRAYKLEKLSHRQKLVEIYWRLLNKLSAD